MTRIGIDLSTTKTGIVALSDNMKVDKIPKTIIDNSKMKNINLVYKNFKIELINFIKSLPTKIDTEFMVGIEISNFSNPKLTQQFSMYAGLIIAILNELNIFNIKWFNCNQWQKLIGCNVADKRDVRKLKAKEFAMSKKINCDNWTQDEIDAYCIAYFLSELNSTLEIQEMTKQKKLSKKQTLQNQLKKEHMVNTRLVKINRLDKIKNKKQIERLKQEIENLGYDIENRVWK